MWREYKLFPLVSGNLKNKLRCKSKDMVYNFKSKNLVWIIGFKSFVSSIASITLGSCIGDSMNSTFFSVLSLYLTIPIQQ